MRTALIVNTKSRKGKTLYKEAQKLLSQRVELDSYAVRRPKKLNQTVKKAITDGCTTIIIGGGDGSIASIVGNLAYTDLKLGILPLGTANSFARTLNIPFELDKAIDVILAGKSIKVDLGKINDKYFANTANIGFSAYVAMNINHGTKQRLGRLAYIWTGIKLLLSYRYFRCTIEHDGGTETMKALEVYLINGNYHGGVTIAPDASLQNNKVGVLVLKGLNKINLFKLWIGIVLGNHTELSEVEYFYTERLKIFTRPKRRVDIDGEIRMKTPVNVSVAADALNVIVP